MVVLINLIDETYNASPQTMRISIDYFNNLNTDFKQKKTISKAEMVSFVLKSLAVSYSHMGRPHTTIGAERFHFRVRKGIGWFPLAIAARKTGLPLAIWIFPTIKLSHTCHIKCFGVIWPSRTSN